MNTTNDHPDQTVGLKPPRPHPRRTMGKVAADWLASTCLHFRYGFQRACGRVILKQLPHQGSGCQIHGPITVIHRNNLFLGDRVRIGIGCYFFAYGGLKIGDNTSISRYVTIYTANHQIEGDCVPYDHTYVSKPVVIGQHVWIGMHVCIIPGVTIGDGAVIGMGAVVSKDVPAGAVLVGSPSRVVRYRDMDRFTRLVASDSYYERQPPPEPPQINPSDLHPKAATDHGRSPHSGQGHPA